MVARQSQSLDGTWDFRHESDADWRQAPVPMPWQAAFADLRQTSGRASYRRSFSAPALQGRVAVLCFGAVGYFATVRVNGQELARHEGHWLPFEVTIPADLLKADNVVEVDCLLPDGNPDTWEGAPFAEIPHGKQSWYGPTGGIWQSVTLELRPAHHLTHCAIHADLATGRVDVALELTGGTAMVEILDPAGKVVGQGTSSTIANIQPWSPDAPALYTARVTVGDDVTTHTFGFRSLTTANGQMFLNGQPWYMRAALDQDYYPVGICTPPSLALLEDQLRKAKELGLNMLRCHIKVPDPRYYEVADRLGMLIWTEIPNVASLTEGSIRRMRETMQGILRRDGNHPSIVIWTLINEDWGTRTVDDAAHRAWLKAEYDWLKAADPTRLVVDNSACIPNFHVKTDLNDYHYYRSVPERRAEWDKLTAEFAGGADWTYTPFGDGERRGDEPLIVSEFGVWGLPNPDEVTINGAEPWWMETGGTWGDGAAYPHGVQFRFASLGLDTVFGGFDAFIRAVQWYQFDNLKYQIEVMRAHPSIQGYVITEFTDVHWESNGLLDMNRNPRVFHDVFGRINADVVIAPRLDRYSAKAGETLRLAPGIATGGKALGAAVLHYAMAGGVSGQVAIDATQPLSMAESGSIDLPVPVLSKAQTADVELRLTVDGAEVARNKVTLSLFPNRAVPSITLHVPDKTLAERARALGYVLADRDKADVTVVHGLAEADIRRIQAGARYLVLADGTLKTNGNLRVDGQDREQPYMPVLDDVPGIPRSSESALPNINLIARHGTMWRGDWIAGFSWIRRKGAFAALPGGPLVDLSYDRIIPHHVMTGFRTHEYAGAVHSGVVVGWVQKPAALIAERRVGKGLLVASTFRLCTDAPGVDPLASALWDALVQTAAQKGSAS
ncbi:glycoside hydrolase family 2 protein [Neogemmobacter tilapiae]|uniref:Glycoside hydrolase family 2 n=1 Tax=Neogemmobacter tilapiae TaxID=875041 RepID=A0A918WPJ4_9RHOB|nr:glycoside hydrolase family 2 TIM barrel-domain containing protein [Gemmobacter tilapiae]GHC65238.1 hypothetical protein GCM10007315_32250 [Gemmobacter tilapiae]